MRELGSVKKLADFDGFKRGGQRGKNQKSDFRQERPKRAHQNHYNERQNSWLPPDDPEVMKLKEAAKANLDRARGQKDDVKHVRLWLNQISPDNYTKK